MLVEIKIKQPANNLDQRIAWHKKKIEEAKARIEYHEAELKRLTT